MVDVKRDRLPPTHMTKHEVPEEARPDRVPLWPTTKSRYHLAPRLVEVLFDLLHTTAYSL
jgi:hypothetical protein